MGRSSAPMALVPCEAKVLAHKTLLVIFARAREYPTVKNALIAKRGFPLEPHVQRYIQTCNELRVGNIIVPRQPEDVCDFVSLDRC